jgi:(S)-2-hydroxyglutarate dehydrogenase
MGRRCVGTAAQAVKPNGTLVDDFQFVPSGDVLHVLNVPSSAATASLAIGKAVVETATKLSLK